MRLIFLIFLFIPFVGYTQKDSLPEITIVKKLVRGRTTGYETKYQTTNARQV